MDPYYSSSVYFVLASSQISNEQDRNFQICFFLSVIIMELNQFKHKNLGSNKISSPFCAVGAENFSLQHDRLQSCLMFYRCLLNFYIFACRLNEISIVVVFVSPESGKVCSCNYFRTIKKMSTNILCGFCYILSFIHSFGSTKF